MRRWIWGFILVHLFIFVIMLGLKTSDIIKWFERNDHVEVAIYKTVADCVTDGFYDEGACKMAEIAARSIAAELTPLYNRQALCEATHQGLCVGPSHHLQHPTFTFYEPQMAGWLMALPDSKIAAKLPVFLGPKPGTLFAPSGSLLENGFGRTRLEKKKVVPPRNREYIIKPAAY